MSGDVNAIRGGGLQPQFQQRDQEGLSDFLRRIQERARLNLEEIRNDIDQENILFYKDLLKRCSWPVPDNRIDTEVKIALEQFVQRKTIQNFSTLNAWIRLKSKPPSLSFFNSKYETPKKQHFNMVSRIEKYVSRTTALLNQATQRYSDDEIRGYVQILISIPEEPTFASLDIIHPLLNYLHRTGYGQLREVVHAALNKGPLAARFLMKLFFDRFLINKVFSTNFTHLTGSLGSKTAASTVNVGDLENNNIALAIESLLREDSNQCKELFDRLVLGFLERGENLDFLKKVFKLMTSEGILYSRVRNLLIEISKTGNKSSSESMRHLMDIILDNQMLVDSFRQNPLTQDQSAAVYQLLSDVYLWNSLPQKIKSRIYSHLFNPMLVHIRHFLWIKKDDVNNKVISIFLNLIDHHGLNLTDENIRYGKWFDGVRKLVMSLVNNLHSHSQEQSIFNNLSNVLLDHLVSISSVTAESGKKLEVIERLLNVFLEMKREHVELLAEKGSLHVLTDMIQEKLHNVRTFQELDSRVQVLEKTFSHLLYAQLYSDKDFEDWFKEENPHIKVEDAKCILDKMQPIRQAIHRDYHDVLQQQGFDHIHNNQIGALATISERIHRDNVFLRLGTGQGKSIIAEKAAIRMLQANPRLKKVFVFTSYDHLARRDCANMKFLSEKSGYPTFYIGPTTSFVRDRGAIEAAKIFHIDSVCFQHFITKNLGEALENNRDVSAFLNIFFDQSNCGVILDEGDLMILDDEVKRPLYGFQNVFGTHPINMKTHKAAFDDMIGRDLIAELGTFFPGAYERWYEREKNRELESQQSVHVASGKVSLVAGSLSHRLAEGKFMFSPFFFNFSSFVRSFVDVVLLSGSIDERNIPVFKGFFTHKKHDFFANVPLYFGSHNLSRKLVNRRTDYLPQEDQWLRRLAFDVEEAIDEGQPILLFASSSQKLEQIKASFKGRSKIGSLESITICDENALENYEKRIGQRGTITFATTICGRGIDIKISKDIEAGLHVVISELPGLNERLLTQMIGRTARQGRKGSFSIIAQECIETFNRQAENRSRISLLNDNLLFNQKILTLSLDFFNRFNARFNPGVIKRWIILQELIFTGSIDAKEQGCFEKIQRFISG